MKKDDIERNHTKEQMDRMNESICHNKGKSHDELLSEIYDNMGNTLINYLDTQDRLSEIGNERMEAIIAYAKKRNKKRIIRNILVSPAMLAGIVPDILKSPFIVFFILVWKFLDMIYEPDELPYPKLMWYVCTRMMYESLYVLR